MPESPFAELSQLQRDAATFASISSLLNWDQETYMPASAANWRAEQQAKMSALVHERKTSSRIGELLAACEVESRGVTNGAAGGSASAVAADIREMRRDYELATKLPTSLVAELAKTTSLAQEAWKHAREKDDFAAFAPWLEKVMALTRQKAQCYGVPTGAGGTKGELYDALLDEYEPGVTAAQVEAIFTPLRARLSGLVADLAKSRGKPDIAILSAKVPADKQHAFGHFVLRAMGFDLSAGRLDTTTHPFCSGLAPGDTRLTTRYRDERFTDALYGTMHEAGHGLYEQGLPKADAFGRPAAEAASLGIHESQSRLWENMVGRSREFWAWALGPAQEHFAPALAGVSVDQMYRAVNTATPTFIRVEADEATYNLHIMLRFSIERALVSGSLAVKDLPGVWNEQFKDMLGLTVPDNRRGCLQDVHWSFGLVGYFPTYTLGNLYAAELWEKLNADIADLPGQISRGEFGPMLAWLRTNIHAHGRRYRAAELCQRATGKPLSADPLLRYLEGKLRPIYGV